MTLRSTALHALAWSIALLALAHLGVSLWGIFLSSTALVIKFMNLLVRVVEVFALSSASLVLLQLADYYRATPLEPLAHYPSSLPPVRVILPVKAASPSLIRRILTHFQQQNYPGECKITLSVDGTPSSLIQQYQSIIQSYPNVDLLVRPTSKGYKAGALNAALQAGSEPYIAIFDIDQVPLPNILQQLVAHLDRLPSQVAFIQAKTTFPNLRTWASRWVAMAYAQLYEIFLKSLDRRNIVLFHGSTGVFRRTALEQVGGFTETYFTEDTATSLKLFLAGYSSRFLNMYGSIGQAPELIKDQWGQMFRWTHGAIHLLRDSFLKLWLSRKLNLWGKLLLSFDIGVFVITTSVFLIATLHLLLQVLNFPLINLGEWSGIMFLAIPIVMTLTYLMSVFLALWSLNVHSSVKYGLTDMILAYLYAFALNGFIIIPVVMGLLGLRKPNAGKVAWNPYFNPLGMVLVFLSLASFYAVPSVLFHFPLDLLGFELLIASMFIASAVAAVYSSFQPFLLSHFSSPSKES